MYYDILLEPNFVSTVRNREVSAIERVLKPIILIAIFSVCVCVCVCVCNFRDIRNGRS